MNNPRRQRQHPRIRRLNSTAEPYAQAASQHIFEKKTRIPAPPTPNTLPALQTQPIHAQLVVTVISSDDAELVERLLALRGPAADIPLVAAQHVLEAFCAAIRASATPATAGAASMMTPIRRCTCVYCAGVRVCCSAGDVTSAVAIAIAVTAAVAAVAAAVAADDRSTAVER